MASVLKLKSLTVTGVTGVVPLSSVSLLVKWYQVITANNSANLNIGGDEVTSAVGFPLPPNWSGQLVPPVAELMACYDLHDTNVYMPALTDALYVLYIPFNYV